MTPDSATTLKGGSMLSDMIAAELNGVRPTPKGKLPSEPGQLWSRLFPESLLWVSMR